MKKQFLLFIAAAFISISSLMAQDASRPARPTPEERTKETMEKLARFDMKEQKRTKVEEIMTNFYKSQQAARQEMHAAGTTDRTVMMEKNKKLMAERDAKLKEVLTEEEYNKWITEIEPTTRPQRQTQAAVPATPN
jgi:hypothetical protein